MSDETNRNQPFDRYTFIDEKKATKAAFSKGTWFVMTEDGEGVVEEPIPESIRATGKIPEGCALGEFQLLVNVSRVFYIQWLGFHLEPSMLISTLAKNNITTVESVTCPLSFSSTSSLCWIWFSLFSQMPSGLLEQMRETMNDVKNVSIAPIDVVEDVSIG